MARRQRGDFARREAALAVVLLALAGASHGHRGFLERVGRRTRHRGIWVVRGEGVGVARDWWVDGPGFDGWRGGDER